MHNDWICISLNIIKLWKPFKSHNLWTKAEGFQINLGLINNEINDRGERHIFIDPNKYFHYCLYTFGVGLFSMFSPESPPSSRSPKMWTSKSACVAGCLSLCVVLRWPGDSGVSLSSPWDSWEGIKCRRNAEGRRSVDGWVDGWKDGWTDDYFNHKQVWRSLFKVLNKKRAQSPKWRGLHKFETC